MIGFAFKTLVILALAALVLAQVENRRLTAVVQGIPVEGQYDAIKLDLLPTQSVTREDPAAHPEARHYKEQGSANPKHVYVIRSLVGQSRIKVGVGFEGRIIWKHAEGLQ